LLTSPTGCKVLVARSDHTTGSRNITLEVVSKVQKMAQYASFCLIMDPFKGNCLFLPDYRLFGRRGVCGDAVSLSRPGNIRVRVVASFMTAQYGRPS